MSKENEVVANDSALPELPRPRCTFADHSYPAFTADQMREYARAVLAAGSGDDAAPVRYFVYDIDQGYNEFSSDEARDKAHRAAIDGYLVDGWSEEVTSVVSGIVTHKTVSTNEENEPEPCTAHPDHDDESCDACEAWNSWPNHDFETCCQYAPEPLVAAAASGGDQEVGS